MPWLLGELWLQAPGRLPELLSPCSTAWSWGVQIKTRRRGKVARGVTAHVVGPGAPLVSAHELCCAHRARRDAAELVLSSSCASAASPPAMGKAGPRDRPNAGGSAGAQQRPPAARPASAAPAGLSLGQRSALHTYRTASCSFSCLLCTHPGLLEISSEVNFLLNEVLDGSPGLWVKDGSAQEVLLTRGLISEC